jgi:DNA helicase-2/ATP-dependent DNA helicase PcrA
MERMPTTPEFEDAYKKLNAEQREAVDAIDGPVFVIAGPGTGKTQVLTLRIAQILQKTDSTPESILALTYTESAAREMRERLSRSIGSTATRVRFHTFHGFAQSLITRYPDHFPRIVGAQIATDAERAELIDAALLNAEVKLLRPFGDPLYYHAAAKASIATLKRENVTPEVLRERVEASEKEFEEMPGKFHEKGKYEGKLKGEFEGLQKKIAKTRDLLAVYELYEKGLTERRRYDYEDLILEAVKALTTDDGFRREVQESLLYILADEHQDANRAQNALLELLVEYSERPNIFIVGDEKQAIYRFQGADLDNVHYFRERFSGTKVVVLKENYRSTQTILDNALALISASPDTRLSRLPLTAQKISLKESLVLEKPITLAILTSPEAEASYLADEILKLISDGVSPDDIAILVRRNRDAAWLAEQLTRREVSVTVGSEEVLRNRFARSLVRLLHFVAEARTEHLAGVFGLPGFNISPADMWRIGNLARTEKIPELTVIGSDKLLEQANVANPESARKLFETLNHLSHDAAIERPAKVAEEAFKASGLLPVLLRSEDRVESLAAIRAFLTMFEQLSEREHDALLPRALELIALHEDRNIQLSTDVTEISHQVKLMTVHKAKGREFKYVFMPRLTESVWSTRPRPEHFYVPDILSGANELEDERRLMYVGLTRAKVRAVLSYSTTREDGKDEGPTPLLEDLDQSLIEKMTSIVEVIDPLMLPEALVPNSRVPGQPTEDDIQTVRAAFLAQGLSPTALNNYIECPSKYFYVNLLRLPEAQNKYMLFGTAIHAALKAYADRRARGDDVNGEYMIGIFSRELNHSALTTRDIEELQEKGKRALTAWWKENQVSWPNKTEAEIPVEAPITLDDGTTFMLRGKLDRIDPLSGNTVRVIDYKTGKQKSRNALMGETKDSDGNYYRQLIAYKLLLAGAPAARHMTEGVIEFVEPDETTGKLRKESFDITQEEADELLDVIKLAAQEIMTLSFWDEHCDNEECEWCELRLGL